jgi:1-acyl-sn-glycerol-3-phosphate acyltransferase
MIVKQLVGIICLAIVTVLCSSGVLITWIFTYPLSPTIKRRVINFFCFDLWANFVTWGSRYVLGMKIVIQNPEVLNALPKDKNLLILADHRNWADVTIILDLFSKWYPRSVIKKAVGDIPFFGWVNRIAGHVVIPRKQDANHNWFKTIGLGVFGKSKWLDLLGRKKNGTFRNTITPMARVAERSQKEKIPFCYFIFPTGTRWRADKANGQATLPAKAGITTTLLEQFHNQFAGVVFLNFGYKDNQGNAITTHDFKTYFRGEIATCEVTLKWIPMSEVPIPGSIVKGAYYQEVKDWLNSEWTLLAERHQTWLSSHTNNKEP